MAPPKPTKHPLTSHQPIRLIYRLLKVGAALAKVPFWLLRALVPALRQHPKWTFKQSFTANLVRTSIGLDSGIAITEPQSLEPGKQGDRWVVIKPFESDFYTGPLLSDLVRPVEVGGTWYPANPPAPGTSGGEATTSLLRPKKVAMHIHGGAFVINNGRDDNTGFLGETYAREGGFDAVFAPQYRLAGHAGRDPFPGALQDALSCYLYLVRTLGNPAEDVTVSGDSAGGNIAIALVRYIESFGDALGVPRPGALVLVSPWVAPLEALTVDYARAPGYGSDFLTTGFLRWGVNAYAVQSDRLEDSRAYVNPLGHPFGTSVPVFVTVGSAEMLCAQGVKWADEMKGLEGNWVVVNLEEGAPHDTLLMGDKIGWDESAAEVARKIKKFVRG